nr:MAG TPA: hypothetical protein [Caudoviricetes sp.]
MKGEYIYISHHFSILLPTALLVIRCKQRTPLCPFLRTSTNIQFLILALFIYMFIRDRYKKAHKISILF